MSKFFKEFGSGPFSAKPPKLILMSPHGLRAMSNQKMHKTKSLCFWVAFKFDLCKTSKFKIVLSKPENPPPFCDFDEPKGPEGCVEAKSCMKPKVYFSGSPSSLV